VQTLRDFLGSRLRGSDESFSMARSRPPLLLVLMLALCAPGATAQVYKWVDEAGRPAIAFRVKGDMNDPQLDPRLRKMTADEIETSKQEGIARAAPRPAWRELEEMKFE